jgi:hypothetical protein
LGRKKRGKSSKPLIKEVRERENKGEHPGNLNVNSTRNKIKVLTANDSNG